MDCRRRALAGEQPVLLVKSVDQSANQRSAVRNGHVDLVSLAPIPDVARALEPDRRFVHPFRGQRFHEPAFQGRKRRVQLIVGGQSEIDVYPSKEVPCKVLDHRTGGELAQGARAGCTIPAPAGPLCRRENVERWI